MGSPKKHFFRNITVKTFPATGETADYLQKNFSAGLNFQNHILVIGQDIEELVALMCYIQISLLGVAGYVKVGNALTEPMTYGDSMENYWFTPMYFSDVWHTRGMIHKFTELFKEDK